MENEKVMNEKNENTEETRSVKPDAESEKATRESELKKLLDPEEQIRRFGQGVMKLKKPIRSRSKDVEELRFDFTALTGKEYVDALDKDTQASNAFRISATQAYNLFAAAAAKATGGIDETDIRTRMSAEDGVKAVQMATIFFTACNRAGNNRISNA